MKILDEYTDGQGVVYRPKLITESHCFLRADHYGHVHVRMCPIDQETGEVKFNRSSYGFVPIRDNPELWMQRNSEGMPEVYYSQAVHDKVGGCQDCSEDELREWNRQRLIDSQKLKDES